MAEDNDNNNEKVEKLQQELEIEQQKVVLAEEQNVEAEKLLELKKVAIEAEKALIKAKAAAGEITARQAAEALTALDEGLERLKEQTEEIKEQEKSFESMGKKLSALGSKAFGSLKQSLLGLDKAQAELAKTTGTGRELIPVMNSASSQVSSLGISFKDTYKAGQLLTSEMSSFSLSNAQSTITATASSLELLGVSASDSASMMEYSQRILGQSGAASARAADEMAAFAIGIGVAPAKMASDFKSAIPNITSYGKNSTKVFKDLARTSKKLGMEMSSLLDLTEKFDSFEGAADAAGRLNAVLGGQFLDAMQLHMAEDPTERAEMIQEALAKTGKSFDNLSRMEKLDIADTLGMDMAAATKLLSESNQDLGKSLQERAVSQEELNQKKAAAVDSETKLANAIENLALELQFVVDIMRGFSEILTKIIQHPIGKFIVIFGMVLGGLVGVIGGIVSSIASFIGILGFAKAGLAAFSASGAGIAAGMASMAAGVAALGAAMIKLGLGVLMVGAGAALLFGSIALLVYSFSVLVDSAASFLGMIIDNISLMPQLVSELFAIGFGIATIAAASLLAGVGLTVLGAGAIVASVGLGVLTAALTAMGSPVALAGGAIVIGLLKGITDGANAAAKFVTSIKELINTLIDNIREIPSAIKSIFSITDVLEDMQGSLASLVTNLQAPISSIIGLVQALSTSFTSVSVAILASSFSISMATSAVSALNVEFQILASLIAKIENSMSNLSNMPTEGITSQIDAIKGIEGLDLSKELQVLASLALIMKKIESSMSNISSMPKENALTHQVNIIKNIRTSDIDALEAIIDEAERYVKINTRFSLRTGLDSISDGIRSLIGLVRDNKSEKKSSANKKEVVVNLDGKELGRSVLDFLDEKIKSNFF